jgi:hypothetical protein
MDQASRTVGAGVTTLLEVLASSGEQLLVSHVRQALRRTGLYELELALERRVIGPLPDGRVGSARLCRIFRQPSGLQPFTEILLLELQDIAAECVIPHAERVRRGLDAIALAGF